MFTFINAEIQMLASSPAITDSKHKWIVISQEEKHCDAVKFIRILLLTNLFYFSKLLLVTWNIFFHFG